VVLQLIMVGIVIAWPGLVTAFLDKASDVDPSKVQVIVPAEEPSTPAPGAAPGKPAEPEDDDLEKQFRK
jgi:hypothetical protein